MDCNVYFKKTIKVLHTLIIWSNLIYLMASIKAFSQKQYPIAVLLFLVAVISTIHHSNIGNKLFGVLDISGAMTAGIYMLYKNYSVNHFKSKVAKLGMYMSLLSLVFFAASTYQKSKYIKIAPEDPNTGSGGPFFTAILPTFSKEKQYKILSQQTIFLVYHTIWHLISGIAAYILVLSL